MESTFYLFLIIMTLDECKSRSGKCIFMKWWSNYIVTLKGS